MNFDLNNKFKFARHQFVKVAKLKFISSVAKLEHYFVVL